MSSYDVTYDGEGRSFARRQKVFVVVRHTRSGDKRVAVCNDDDTPEARAYAMAIAEDVADRAARDYGNGSSSVFQGTLIVSRKAKALQA